LESFTCTVTVKVLEAVGVQLSVDVPESVHPVGRDIHE
jgi:hypothetical protein